MLFMPYHLYPKYWSSLQVEQDIATCHVAAILVHPRVFNHTANITTIVNVRLVNRQMAILPPEIILFPVIHYTQKCNEIYYETTMQ